MGPKGTIRSTICINIQESINPIIIQVFIWDIKHVIIASLLYICMYRSSAVGMLNNVAVGGRVLSEVASVLSLFPLLQNDV